MSIFHTNFHARIGQYWEVWKVKIISVFTWHSKQRLKTHTAFSKSFQNFCCCYVSIVPAGPRGTKYECPYCPLPLLLPQFLRLILCPSCACNTPLPLCTPDCTSVPLYLIVPPCPPPSCRRPGVVLCGGLVRPGLGLRGERCPAETSIYPAQRGLRSKKEPQNLWVQRRYNGQSTKEFLS